MRHKQNLAPYFLIFGLIFLLMSLPKKSTEKIRGFTVAMLAPAWEQIADLKVLLTLPQWSSERCESEEDVSSVISESEAVLKLQLENQNLKHEIHKLQELFEHELFLIDKLVKMREAEAPSLLGSVQQHQRDLLALFNSHLDSVPARVIFRSPSSWSSSLWIDAGRAENEEIGREVIQVNSPVVVGDAIVGVVDYVGLHQSRVRLITDSGLRPSVRVARGAPQDLYMIEHLQALSGALATRNDLFENSREKNLALKSLEKIKETLQPERESLLLAKGEMHGSSQPLWRSHGQKLKGIGFNYDYPDNEGPARDLRSGEPLNAPDGFKAEPLIKEDDLLVTTGFDGLFPPGLRVASVTMIHLLREGDYFYELEALPSAGDLNELSLLFVLPPVGYDPQDKAPFIRH